jgi:pyruvate dehydrogenase kinase 2/3/4
MSRVGLRLLVEHHVLSSPYPNVQEFRKQQAYLRSDDDDDEQQASPFLGAISNKCDPVIEVQRVLKQVREDCISALGMAPEIQVVDCCENPESRHFTYVPHHLHYMLAELLSNSCRAVVNHHKAALKEATTSASSSEPMSSLERSMHKMNGHDSATTSESLEGLLPPIQVVITIGAEDCTIKVADRGGGVPRSACQNIWTFAQSTIQSSNNIPPPSSSCDFDKNVFTNTHGRGFGLPMAKMYAQYFGGDLTLKSMEGYGVDAYLHLPVLGVQCENLPQSVYNSPGNLDSTLDLARRFRQGENTTSRKNQKMEIYK